MAHLRFAPVSSAPSTLLSVAAGFFVLSGALSIVVTGTVLVGQLLGWDAVAAVALHPLNVALTLLFAAGWIWTGLLLGRGERRGGVLALLFTLLPPVAALVQRQPIGGASLVWHVISLVVITRIWRDLR